MQSDLRVYEFRLLTNPKFLCSSVHGDTGGRHECNYDPDYDLTRADLQAMLDALPPVEDTEPAPTEE